jgi:choline dehydrogenase-like flavoprotein
VLRGDNDYPGWRWADVLPHFRAMEGNNRLTTNSTAPTARCSSPIPGHHRRLLALVRPGRAGARRAYNHDFNGPTQRGVGFYQFMNRRGKRSSAAYAFIAPLEGHPNFQLRLNARVHRIDIENGRAVGVTYRDSGGVERRSMRTGRSCSPPALS